MTSEEIRIAAAELSRRRVSTALIKSMAWYRAMPEAHRVEVEELLGICCGSDPVTAEAYVQAYALAKELNER